MAFQYYVLGQNPVRMREWAWVLYLIMDRSGEAGDRDKIPSGTQPSPTSSNFQNLLSSQWETAGDILYLNHNISMCQIYLKLVISHKYTNNLLILLFSVSQSLLKLVHRSCGTGW